MYNAKPVVSRDSGSLYIYISGGDGFHGGLPEAEARKLALDILALCPNTNDIPEALQGERVREDG